MNEDDNVREGSSEGVMWRTEDLSQNSGRDDRQLHEDSAMGLDRVNFNRSQSLNWMIR